MQLADGAAHYLQMSEREGLLMVGLGAAAIGAGWAASWVDVRSASPLRRSAAFLLWLGITTLPCALGSLMVAHPLLSAGFLMPGTGWLGLWALVVLMAAASQGWAMGGLVALALLACARGTSMESPLASGWLEAVETNLLPSDGSADVQGELRVALASQRAMRRTSAQVVVLPEGAAGVWTDEMRRLWAGTAARFRAQGRTFLVGASLERADGTYDNAVVALGAAGEQSEVQRLPIPGAMWRPWTGGAPGSFRAHLWDDGVLELHGRRLGILVCWEGALVAPALLSMAAGAEALALVANHAWVDDGGLPTVVAARAWGALFGVPVVVARNASSSLEGM
jgi:predicted amidohydrolase